MLDLKPDPGITDLERHFGLVRTNGTPKPSFYALKNLLHLLADSGSAAPAGSRLYLADWSAGFGGWTTVPVELP